MTIKPEVVAAIESLKNDAFSWIELADVCDKAQIDLQLIQSELLAMDARLDRLKKSDALLRDIYVWGDELPSSIQKRIETIVNGAPHD